MLSLRLPPAVPLALSDIRPAAFPPAWHGSMRGACGHAILTSSCVMSLPASASTRGFLPDMRICRGHDPGSHCGSPSGQPTAHAGHSNCALGFDVHQPVEPSPVKDMQQAPSSLFRLAQRRRDSVPQVILSFLGGDCVLQRHPAG